LKGIESVRRRHHRRHRPCHPTYAETLALPVVRDFCLLAMGSAARLSSSNYAPSNPALK